MSKLTHFALCPLSRSIRILLAEIGMPFDLAAESPWEWRAQFLALNPSGDLPVLELDDGLVLAGAYAISEYMGEVSRTSPPDDRPEDPFPGSLEDRAEVRRIVDWFHRKMHREVTREVLEERVYGRLDVERKAQPPDAAMLRALRANLRYHMSYVGYLADQRTWLGGDTLSFADMAAVGHISVLDYLDEIQWEAYPQAREWYVRMKSRPSVRPLLADRVTGIAPPAHYADPDF
ncbi:MAG: glutathione S-transferase family protein [Hyphomicrobiaceae bacterium]